MKAFLDKLLSLRFEFTKKRVKLALVLIIIFIFIATMVELVHKYNNTYQRLQVRYEKELRKNVELEDKEAIKIEKYDLNLDGFEDYIALIGKKKIDSLGNVLELYSSVDLIFLDGKSNESIKYSTGKEFDLNVTFQIYEQKDQKNILITDETSGNVYLLKLENDKFIDIINESFGDKFSGYTINAEFNKDDNQKMDVKLDGFGKSYLPQVEENYTLDFDEDDINLENYRQTYNLDKFSKIQLIDTDEDGILELVTTQYVLYLYKEVENKGSNLGLVKVIFKFEDGKYKAEKVSVEK